MNNRYYFFVLLLCFATAVRAQLKCANPILNMGEIGWHVPKTVEFVLQNKSRHAVVMHDVRTSCGCTSVQWEQGQLLEAGQKVNLKVTYDAELLGAFDKVISVSVRDGKELKNTDLRIQGKVLSSIVDYTNSFPCNVGENIYLSGNVLEFDDVQKDGYPTKQLRVMNGTKTDYTPNVMHLPSWLQVLCEPEVLKPGRAGTMTFIVDASQIDHYGLMQASVYLQRYLGDRVDKKNEIQLSLTMVPHVEVDAASLEKAPRAEVDTVVQLRTSGMKHARRANGSLTIRNSGHSPLEINRLQVYNLGLQVSLDKSVIEPGGSATLGVKGWAERKGAQYKGSKRILLITNDPLRPKITIEVK